MTIKNKASEIANRCSDAYSSGRYNSWTNVATALLKRGYSEKEVEAIMRSKWMRWAGDNSDNRFGKYTSGDILRFIDNPRNGCTREEVKKLTLELFG